MDPNTSCSRPYDAPEYIGVTIASVISGFISFLASSLVLFLILVFKKWGVMVQRLVLYLSIASLLFSVSVIIHRVDYVDSNQDKDNFCVAAGFFEQHGGWMLLNAVACITFHLFLCAVLNVRLEKLEWVYFSLIFFVPLLWNWIPFIELAYGRAGAWCWIRDQDNNCNYFNFGRILRFVLWYIPLYVILILLIILYVFILYKLHRTRRHWVGRYDPNTERVKEQTRSEVAPLVWYPVIYLVLNIFPLINRIHNFVSPDNPNLGLWYIHAITYPLVGAFIALPFLISQETRRNFHWSNLKSAWSNDDNVREYPLVHEGTKIEDKTNTSSGNGTSSYNSFEDKTDS